MTRPLPADTFDLALSIAASTDREALHDQFVADHSHLHPAVVDSFWDAACARADRLTNPGQ